MNLFYEPDLKHINYLNETESFHCKHTLRLKKNDITYITDGKGLIYRALLTNVNPTRCEFKTIDKSKKNKPKHAVHIAISPPKNIKRMEWFVEKSTELGISTISPIICKHSERKKLNIDRLTKISIAAMKQSKQAYLPLIKQIIPFTEFLTLNSCDACFIAYQDKMNKHLLFTVPKAQSITILIGPEGDFNRDEIEQAINANYQPVSLGKNVLRTETAGILACHTINLIN